MTEQRRSNCPHCDDTRQRYYEKDTDGGTLFICFNCGKSGLKRRGHRTPAELREKYKDSMSTVLQSIIPSQQSVIPSYDKRVRLPYDFSYKIPSKGLAWFYKYAITDEDIKKFHFGYSEKYNRIILPIYEDEKLLYYQARTLAKPSKDNPKYINIRQSGAKNVFFKAFNDTSKIVLVEDILSAVKISHVKSALALLGSYIPSSIIEVLEPFDKIVIWLDRDKLEEALSYAKKLRLYTGKQVSVIIKDLDPKEYSIDEIKEILN